MAKLRSGQGLTSRPSTVAAQTASARPQHLTQSRTLLGPLPSPAGKLLAHLLLSGAHGDRPVKLVSHGMGARLVFHCLLELCRQGARGVVQVRRLMWRPLQLAACLWLLRHHSMPRRASCHL